MGQQGVGLGAHDGCCDPNNPGNTGRRQALFPAANITQLAPWHGHMPEGTFFLPPTGAGGALFKQIGAKFLARQAAALGVAAWEPPHYYL